MGFQCPDCIAEGRRTTRQPRRSVRSRLGWNRPGAAPVTMILIAINVLVWAAINVSGRYGSRLYELFAFRQRASCASDDGGIYPIADTQARCALVHRLTGQSAHWVLGVSDGAPWQLLTSVFTHVELWHIGANMFSLYVVGTQLEPALGKLRFLAIYLLSGLAGSALVYWVADPTVPTVGASGAIFGLLGAIMVFYLKARQPLQQIIILLVINFAITFTIPGISWGAHVGGFIGGAAAGGVLAYTRADRRRRQQLGGLIGIALVIVGAVIVRTAVLT